MTTTLDNLREIALLARQIAEFARVEGEANLASNLEAIADATARTPADAIPIELMEELRTAYLDLMKPKESGLANFFRWHPDIAARKRLNAELEHARTRLGQLMGAK